MAPGAAPNVLLIMTDQQQAASLGCYGSRVARTPHIDGLAAAGVRVDHAVCNYPACTPARAAVHTGRDPHATGVRANHIHLPANEITLPLLLRRAGYELALIGKNHVFADGRPLTQFRVGGLALRDWPRTFADLAAVAPAMEAEGLLEDQRDLFDHWFGADHFAPQGPEFDDVRAFSIQPALWRSHAGTATSPFPAERHTSAVLGDRAAAFVRDRARADRPWFMWLSFPDPHNPYIAPEPFASMFDPADVDLPPVDTLDGKPERQRIASRMCGMHAAREIDVRRAIAMQHAQVAGLDAAVGTVLAALDDSGTRQNTVVVFLTDHGGYLGDHGAWHKAPAFYDCLIRIPLLVSWPGTLAPGQVDDGLVEQVDLLPTILELLGMPSPPGVQGRSMVRALEGTRRTARAEAFAEVGEPGAPVSWADLPFRPDDPLDGRWFPWDGFQETWVGQGKMVRTTEWKYAWYANGEEELYDMRADPHELHNLAAVPAHEERRRAFRDRLLLWTVEAEDPLPVHAGNIYLDDVVSGRLPW
jgi:arylsulfatase A-like enzyme